MKILISLISFTLFYNYALAQQTNNATVNIIGNTQNVIITQSGNNHNTNLNFVGDGVSAIINQSGTIPKTFNLNVTCYSNCPSNPYVVNQYE